MENEEKVSQRTISAKEESSTTKMMNSQNLKPLRSSTGAIKRKFKPIKQPRASTRKQNEADHDQSRNKFY